MRDLKIKNKIKLVFLILLIFGLPRSGLSKNSLLSFELDEGKLQFPISLTERIESLSKFKIDRYNNDFARAPIYSSQIRTGLHYNSKKQFDDFKIELELEADVLTGVHQGKIKDEAAYVPDTQDLKNQIRKAYLGFSYSNILHGKFGFNTSDWGMGLIANGGSRRAKEGSALFLDPRGGDLVLRALLAYGPFTDGSILIGFAADKVQNDGALYEGDTAYQFAGSVIYGFLKENSMGFYAAKRQQETDKLFADRSSIGISSIQ